MEDMIYPLKDLLSTLGWLTAIVIVVWFYYRYKKLQEDQRTDLMMKALEKSDNPDDSPWDADLYGANRWPMPYEQL